MSRLPSLPGLPDVGRREPGKRNTGGGGTLQVGLAVLYGLDEASGQRNDSYTNALHLTDNNTVGSSASGLGGVTVADFVAANQEYLSRSDHAALSMGSGQSFSAAVWVRFTTVTSTTILSKAAADTQAGIEWEIVCDTAGNFYFRLSDGSGAGLDNLNQSPGAFNTSTWYLVIGQFDAPNSKLYCYVQNSTSTPSGKSTTRYAHDGGGSFRLGNRQGSSSYFNGKLAPVGVWKRMLTANERSYLWNGGTAFRTPAEILAASP